MKILNQFSREDIALPALMMALATLVPPPVEAHEDKHTHAELSVASVHFLDSQNIENEEARMGWSPGRIAALLRQGSIDEDRCPLYANHFYNPANPTQLITPASNRVDDNCEYIDGTPNYPPNPHYDHTNPDEESGIPQQTAKQRAGAHWDAAIDTYRRGLLEDDEDDFEDAYLLLGHVFHLMQDMTSPAHVHNDPHGKHEKQRGDGDCVQQDADDFENWGLCVSEENIPVNQHVFDYLWPNGTFGSDGTNIKSRTRAGLVTMYDNEPQFADLIGTENSGHAYVRHVAETTFDFSTFEVKLRDTTFLPDDQPGSELKSMFPSLKEDEGNDFVIDGDGSDIGFSDGRCGRSEGFADFKEEWWPMENSTRWPCSRTANDANATLTLDGYAYIENSGGDGPGSFGIWDSLRPERYFKDLYVQRYGTNQNSAGRSLLRIYGDVLYPTAVAYGAGLLQSFIVEVLDPPVADADGPYISDGCYPIIFDASESFDANDDGYIVSYGWDFDDDGEIDLTTDSPTVEYFYSNAYQGKARLVVTDNEGFTGETRTDVSVNPDKEAPVIEAVEADPKQLWPPNHKMMPITVSVEVIDRCSATCEIADVTHNEIHQNIVIDNREEDWLLTDNLTLNLRAERDGKGNGRTYELSIQCSDPAGNSSFDTTTVTVRHDARKNSKEYNEKHVKTARK